MSNTSEALKVAWVVGLFVLTGLAEIGGGWLVWQACRENKPWWWALAGSALLIVYGFVPCLQPIDDFGRLYAAYGGIFIGMAYLWGRVFDGLKPDRGDLIGSLVAVVGVGIILFWPRKPAASSHAAGPSPASSVQMLSPSSSAPAPSMQVNSVSNP